jgi:hypothetical protein
MKNLSQSLTRGLQGPSEFKGNSIISTPKDLVKQMVDMLPEEAFKSETTTFLDPACGYGTFLMYIYGKLRKYHSHENSVKRIYGIDKFSPANETKKMFPNIIKKDFLNMEFPENWPKEFNSIVSNPPYQSPNNKADKLWVRFLDKSIDIADNVLFVAPQLICSGNTRPIQKIREKVSPYLVKMDCNAKDYFPGIGEKVCWYLLDKNSKSETFTLINNDGIETTQMKNQDHFYTNSNDSFQREIFNKIENNKYPKFPFIRDFNEAPKYLIEQDIASDLNSLEYPYLLHHSASNKLYLKTPGSTFGKIKVVINFSGGYYSIKNPEKYMFITQDCIGKQMYGIEVGNLTEGGNLISLLSSKAYRYYIEKSKTGGFNVNLHKIPNIGYHKRWTDKEIYSILEFSDKQIELILPGIGDSFDV